MTDLENIERYADSLYGELEAEKHAHRKDNEYLLKQIERLRDRAVCSGCGVDVPESGECPDDCGEGEMIPASDLPWALRQMRAQRDEALQELMSQ